MYFLFYIVLCNIEYSFLIVKKDFRAKNRENAHSQDDSLGTLYIFFSLYIYIYISMLIIIRSAFERIIDEFMSTRNGTWDDLVL